MKVDFGRSFCFGSAGKLLHVKERKGKKLGEKANNKQNKKLKKGGGGNQKNDLNGCTSFTVVQRQSICKQALYNYIIIHMNLFYSGSSTTKASGNAKKGRKRRDYTPVKWDQYFNNKRDITVKNNV